MLRSNSDPDRAAWFAGAEKIAALTGVPLNLIRDFSLEFVSSTPGALVRIDLVRPEITAAETIMAAIDRVRHEKAPTQTIPRIPR